MSIVIICVLLVVTACSNGLVFCSRIPSHSLGRPYPVQYDEVPFESDPSDRWHSPFYTTSDSRYPRQIIQRETRDTKDEIGGNIFTRIFNRLNFLDFLANFNRFGGSQRSIRSVNSPVIRKKSNRRRHRHGRRPHKRGHRRPRSTGLGYRPGHFYHDETNASNQPGPGLATLLQNLLRNTISETIDPAWSLYERYPLIQTPLLQPFYNRADFYYPDDDDDDYSSEDSNESQESEDSRESEESRESDEHRQIKNSGEGNDSIESKAQNPNQESPAEEQISESVPKTSDNVANEPV